MFNRSISLVFFFLLFSCLSALNTKGNNPNRKVPFWQANSSNQNRYVAQKSYQQSYSVQDEASAEPTPQIPQTSFVCDNKPYNPGMYADEETDCRVYHVCVDERKDSFFCGDGTVFNQEILTCDYPKNVNCAESQRFWSANLELGKPGAEPSPNTAQKSATNVFRPTIPRQKTFSINSNQYSYQSPKNTYSTGQKIIRSKPQSFHRSVKNTIYEPIQQTRVENQNYEPNNFSPYFPEQPSSDWSSSSSSSSSVKKIFKNKKTLSQPSNSYKQASSSYTNSYNQPNHQEQSYSYSQPSNAPNGWKPSSSANLGGGISYSQYQQENTDITLPQTNFQCENKPYEPGMYADEEADCEIYHVCFDGRKETFACGKGTVFSQKLLTCDYTHKVNCKDTPKFYSSNENLVQQGNQLVFKQHLNNNYAQDFHNANDDGWSSQKQI